jgi:hypothetical protein
MRRNRVCTLVISKQENNVWTIGSCGFADTGGKQ